MKTQKCICDYCGESKALLYCRADSAKVCFSCDKEVHSTNQLFGKHVRSILCDCCYSFPASILCETEQSVLCQNCDWERHSVYRNVIHIRRPIDGFNGCPCVNELMGILGFDDFDKKSLFLSDESDSDFGSAFGFDDLFVWETPCVGSFDDLICEDNDGKHDFQAIGVLPLPKNRNTVCGQHKDEVLRQLRELAKLEPKLNYENLDAEPPNISSQALVRDVQPGNILMCTEYDAKPVSCPAHVTDGFQWCSSSDHGEASNQAFSHTIEESCVVPDKQSDTPECSNNARDEHDGLLQNKSHSVLPKFAPSEFTSQERDIAISRYKEKKKTRRYDGHIRYESRKARAETRVRINGRFAKTD